MTKAEQYIEDYQRGCSNELVSIESKESKKVISYYPWLTPDQARRAVEIAREETIEKACEWIENFLECSTLIEYQVTPDEIEKQINDFRKAMEE